MEHLRKLLETKPDAFEAILQEDVEITLKVDGAAFQITAEPDGQILYHKRSGSTFKVGPVIDDFALLYNKHLEDAVEYFDQRKDILKKYTFLVFEIFNGNYVLIAAMNGTQLIEDPSELNDIASKLGCYTVPVIFNGKLDVDQQDAIQSYLENSSENFEDFLRNVFAFDKAKYKDFLKEDGQIEGIVLDFNVLNKHALYKIVDNAFEAGIKQKRKDELDVKKSTEDTYNKVVIKIVDYLYDAATRYEGTKWNSLNKNFVEMCNNASLLNDLLLLCGKLPSSKFNPSIKRIDKDVAKLIKTHGTPMKNMYEIYTMTFHATRSRHYIIDKDTQNKINLIIGKM